MLGDLLDLATLGIALRVPLLTIGGVVFFALWAPRSTMFRGVLDVDPRGLAVSTLVALLLGATAALSAVIILENGPQRFHTPQPPAWWLAMLFRILEVEVTPLRLLAWAVCLGASGLLVLRALRYGAGWSGRRLLAVLTGAGLFGLLAAVPALGVAQAPLPDELLASTLRISPNGYIDASTGRLHSGHTYAFLFFLLSGLVYVAVGLWRYLLLRRGTPTRYFPTLACLLLLGMSLCWLLAGIGFFFDRFHVPVLLPLLAWFVVTAQSPYSDHYFAARFTPATPVPASPADVLRASPYDSAIVVCASGGGIHQAAWSSRVLSGLQEGLAGRHGEALSRAIRLVSAVSGGSVGALYFLAAYRDGRLPEGEALRRELMERATRSSLDAAAWGLVYPDALRTAAPWFAPRYVDRGWALERAWDAVGGCGASLAAWRSDAARGLRPAVAFNTTLAESGEKLVIGTFDLSPAPIKEYVRRTFQELHPGWDLAPVTAARLSATFPYVAPAARIGAHIATSAALHFVDGGYYDNYGFATAAEFLREGLAEAGGPGPVRRILLLQIRGAAPEAYAEAHGHRGWFYQLLAPLQSLLSVRTLAQRTRNHTELRLLQEALGARGVELTSAEFTFPFADEPLSWHLSRWEIEAIEAGWRKVEKEEDGPVSVVDRFLQGMTLRTT